MLFPSAGLVEQEVQKILPEGVSLHVTRIPMRSPNYQELTHLADRVEEAAGLLADARVDVIAFNCTLGSLIRGVGYDREIIERIQKATGVPATTTATAVLEGLRTLGIGKLVLVTPYVEEMNQIERAFLEAQGFQVLSHKGLGLQDPFEQMGVEPARWYRMAKEEEDTRADGYFLSCAGIRVVDVLGSLEEALGKPVIASNQALAWHCLKILGVREPVQGYGALLSDHP
jgi:maleate isomerase